MAAKNLCTADDVADMWRPLVDDTERSKVERLVGKASQMLRQKLPSVDARIAAYAVDPTDETGLSPDTVAAVVATVVKRFLSNPDGATHVAKTLGGASVSTGFALRGDTEIRGELVVLETDLDKLAAPVSQTPRLATLKTKHRLAPPCGPTLADEFAGDDIGMEGGSPPDTWLGVVP